MTDILWGVDIQRDFMYEDGKLYVPGAEDIVLNAAKVTRAADEAGILRVMSADDHVYTDAEITLGEPDPANGLFNPHCMRGTYGAMLIPPVRLDNPVIYGTDQLSWEQHRQLSEEFKDSDGVLLLKNHFNVFTNPHAEEILETLEPVNVYVYGVATDVCVIAAVTGMTDRGHNVTVITDAIAGIGDCTTILADWEGDSAVRLLTTDQFRTELASIYS